MTKLNFPERLAFVEQLGFKHGAAFVLAEEVVNPTPDRRHSYDWRKLANIPAGKRFRVVEERHNHDLFDGLDDGLDGVTRARLIEKHEKNKRFVLEPCNDSYAFSHRLQLWSDSDAALWDAIVPHLVRDERSFDDVMWHADNVANVDGTAILRYLVETKRLTFFDIDMLVDELAAKQAAEEKRAEEKEKAS